METIPAVSRAAAFDFDNFTFGQTPTDHMLTAQYHNGRWEPYAIQPFGNLSLSPFALGLHYGQTVFEGLKAYRMADGRINIFRPERHFGRINHSLRRMCMPELPEALFIDGLKALIRKESDWIPARPEIALYIRPFVVATEARLGVKVSDDYTFAIVCTPIGKYYARPLKVKVETRYVRAAEGGVGSAKCGGNYGGAFYPARLAMEEGFDQVIWTDSRHNEYIEESGTMNIVFQIGDRLVTPALSSSILDGVTRDSLLCLARDHGIVTEERKISYHELQEAIEAGEKVQAFGVGTAAVVTTIASIHIAGRDYQLANDPGALIYTLQKQLEAIRTGNAPDKHGWNCVL